MHRAIPLGLRALQLLTALTILALAVTMIKNQVLGSSPVTTRYSTFTGGFGMIVSGVGLLSLFVTFIPGIVPIALDTLAGFLFLGGGIAWAYGLRQTSNCSDGRAMLLNDLLNQGSQQFKDGIGYGVTRPDDTESSLFDRLRGNCQRAQADEILQFISFAIAAGLVALGYLGMKKGWGGRTGAGAYVA